MPPDPEIHYVYIHDFPSHIDISKDFNIHIIGYIFGYITVNPSAGASGKAPDEYCDHGVFSGVNSSLEGHLEFFNIYSSLI